MTSGRRSPTSARPWYRSEPADELFQQPAATEEQRQHARALLRVEHRVPIEDRDGHLGALDDLRAHILRLYRTKPKTRDLLPAVRRSCSVPGLTDGRLLLSGDAPRWAWIDPRRVVHDDLGQPFEPYHDTVRGLAEMAVRIIRERADPAGLQLLFGGPDEGAPCIVVNRLSGPLGPVHVVSVNGLHRTAVLRALEVPAVVAEVHDVSPPYRILVRNEETQRATLEFVRWLEAQGVVQLGRRPVVTTRYGLRYVRVVAAAAPFLLAPPAEALAAVDAYERIVGQRVPRFGPLDTGTLRATWSHAVQDRHDEPTGADVIPVAVETDRSDRT